MVASRLLELAACRGKAPLWDWDAHHHDILGSFNSCWMCEEAEEICGGCPVRKECAEQAVYIRESYQIRAGQMWSSGRPKALHIRKRRRG